MDESQPSPRVEVSQPSIEKNENLSLDIVNPSQDAGHDVPPDDVVVLQVIWKSDQFSLVLPATLTVDKICSEIRMVYKDRVLNEMYLRSMEYSQIYHNGRATLTELGLWGQATIRLDCKTFL